MNLTSRPAGSQLVGVCKKHTKNCFVKAGGRPQLLKVLLQQVWGGAREPAHFGAQENTAAVNPGPHPTTISSKHPRGGMQTNTLSHGPFKTHVPETNEQRMQRRTTDNFGEVRDRESVVGDSP